VKLVIDENLPARWKEFLSPHGIEALHWTEIVGRALLKVLQDHEFHLNEGCLISLDLERHRLCLLPLH
jgi:predicted nuclease of predicted toxin-antitoxin system